MYLNFFTCSCFFDCFNIWNFQSSLNFTAWKKISYFFSFLFRSLITSRRLLFRKFEAQKFGNIFDDNTNSIVHKSKLPRYIFCLLRGDLFIDIKAKTFVMVFIWIWRLIVHVILNLDYTKLELMHKYFISKLSI